MKKVTYNFNHDMEEDEDEEDEEIVLMISKRMWVSHYSKNLVEVHVQIMTAHERDYCDYTCKRREERSRQR